MVDCQFTLMFDTRTLPGYDLSGWQCEVDCWMDESSRFIIEHVPCGTLTWLFFDHLAENLRSSDSDAESMRFKLHVAFYMFTCGILHTISIQSTYLRNTQYCPNNTWRMVPILRVWKIYFTYSLRKNI